MKREIKHYGGSRLNVSFRRDEKDARPVWAGHYRVSTKGRSSEQIAAEIRRLQEQHEKKCERLRGFSSMVKRPLKAGAEPLEWRACTIRPRGTDVELIAVVRDPAGQRHTLRGIYPAVDGIPNDEAIAEMIVAMVAAAKDDEAAEQAKLVEVQALLGNE